MSNMIQLSCKQPIALVGTTTTHHVSSSFCVRSSTTTTLHGHRFSSKKLQCSSCTSTIWLSFIQSVNHMIVSIMWSRFLLWHQSVGNVIAFHSMCYTTWSLFHQQRDHIWLSFIWHSFPSMTITNVIIFHLTATRGTALCHLCDHLMANSPIQCPTMAA